MCFFSKKSLLKIGFLNQFTDYHTHILPGVDDGLKTVEDALALLDLYEKNGVKKVVFTPHIMDEYPQNNSFFLKNRFEEFLKLYKGNIELRLGAEYMIDSKFGEHIQNGNLLTIKDHFLLVETSYAFEPPGFLAAIKEAIDKGYQIVLAHPERYSFMTRELHRQLRQLGVLYQLNIPSLLGFYGPKVQQNAKELLERDSYHFLGSDIHRLASFEQVYAKRKLSQREILSLKSKV
jgi:protein-tyrosine phosphatase